MKVEVHLAVNILIAVFCVVSPRGLGAYQRFEERITSNVRVDTDVRDTLLRNVGNRQQDYMASQARRPQTVLFFIIGIAALYRP